MKQYQVRVIIESVGEKTGEQAEVHLGKLQAESMDDVVKFAGTFGAAFAASKPKDAVAEHERLVAKQNKAGDPEKKDAKPPAN